MGESFPLLIKGVFMLEPDFNLKGLPSAIVERFYSGEKKIFLIKVFGFLAVLKELVKLSY